MHRMKVPRAGRVLKILWQGKGAERLLLQVLLDARCSCNQRDGIATIHFLLFSKAALSGVCSASERVLLEHQCFCQYTYIYTRWQHTVPKRSLFFHAGPLLNPHTWLVAGSGKYRSAHGRPPFTCSCSNFYASERPQWNGLLVILVTGIVHCDRYFRSASMRQAHFTS